MVIEEEDFRLTSVNEHSIHFDLELLYIVKPRGGELRREFKNVAYALPLDAALKKVAQYRINQKHSEALKLNEYLNEFKEEIESLKALCVH